MLSQKARYGLRALIGHHKQRDIGDAVANLDGHGFLVWSVAFWSSAFRYVSGIRRRGAANAAPVKMGFSRQRGKPSHPRKGRIPAIACCVFRAIFLTNRRLAGELREFHKGPNMDILPLWGNIQMNAGVRDGIGTQGIVRLS